nr:MAK10-like protein [Tanacetum cinerariifolium]
MGDKNPIHTLGDYSKPSHEGYQNTIELSDGNNVVPLRSDPIRRTIDQSTGGKLRDKNVKESWALLEGLALYVNESWNDPRDFAKPVKTISLPQDVPSTPDRRCIELKNQVQRLMEAHLAPKSSIQVNKIASSCEIYSGPHDTQYCMENPEQAFVDYASSRIDKAGGKWFTFKLEQNYLGDTYNPSWKSHPNLRSAFIQGEMPEKIKDPGLFTLPCRLGDSKPFDTLADLVMKKDPTTPLLIGRGFLATVSVVIDCKKAKIAVGEGIDRSIFGVKEINIGDEEVPYWTTLGKRESYEPRPSTDDVGARTPFYVRKDFMDHHLPWEWQIARDAELNPFKDVLVFRKMIEFLGVIPINLKGNMWESKELINKKIDWNRPPKE